MVTSKKIGEFYNLNIAGQPVNGTLIQKTKLGKLIDQIKKIFNNYVLPENSIFIYRDNDTKQIVHKKITITENLSKNAQYGAYHTAHACLAEAIAAEEELRRNFF